MIKYKGTGIGKQMASGRLKFFKEKPKKAADVSEILSSDEELKKYRDAKETVLSTLRELEERARAEIGQKEAQIFEIHIMLLEDEDFCEAIEFEIQGGNGAQAAVISAAGKYIDMLSSLDDEYLSARVSDIKDLSNQLLEQLSSSENEEKADTYPHILVARDLTPSQTMLLDKSALLGFVTFEGTPTSHTSILARAMGIPALVGTGEISSAHDGEIALLDAETQTVIIAPSGEQIIEFEKKQSEKNKLKREHEEYLRSLINKPAVSKGGHRVLIYSNIGGEYEVSSALENGAEGVGLLRSEFLYLTLDKLPSENELFEAYKSVAIKMGGRRVVIRTLDIGADKQISYLDLAKEENPALGYRGIRICLENKELFKTQIRAILRASAYGMIALMLPMVISPSEVIRSKELIEECKCELFEENEEFDARLELGIMVETPAAAIMCKELAEYVDFFSVGTNDLTQYTLAVDRQNPKVAHLCDSNLEPVLRLIESASEAIHERGGWIGICGELGANLNLTQRFVDMKIDELSVSTPYLLGVRKRVSECK